MPSRSEKQRNFIFAKRSEYKTKSNTPEDWQWVWDSEWEKIEERLPMKRYKPLFESDIYDSLLKFDGSDADIKQLKEWLSTLNLKSGKAPSGMAKQYAEIKFLQKQIDMIEAYKGSSIGVSNIKATLQHLTKDDLIKLTQKLSAKEDEPTTLELKNAIYHNESISSYQTFKKNSEAIDKFLGTLTGFHKKALTIKPLNIYFVKKDAMKSKAKYITAKDVFYIRPDKIESGDKYASLLYIIVHELGHRYLHFNKVSFRHNDPEWITTPYSKTDSMTEEEKFAELFALSFFKYSGKPFEDYKDKIEKFVGLVK